MPRKTIGVKSVPEPSNSELSETMLALKKENAKLHKRIAKYEAEKLSDKNEIAALKTELAKRPSLSELVSGANRLFSQNKKS